MIQHEKWTHRDGTTTERDQEYIFAVHGPIMGVDDALLGFNRDIETAKDRALKAEEYLTRNDTLVWEHRPGMTAYARSAKARCRYLIIRHQLDD